MSDWFPGARQRLISNKVRSRGTSKPNAFVLHIAAGNSNTLYSFFSNPSRGCSHFYVLRDGTIEQYLPIYSKSGSELYGNHRTVSVETQGGAGWTTKLPWTAEQTEALAKIAAWLNEEHGIPLRLMENSRTETAGVGYHRLGIPGNFPQDPLYGGLYQRGGGEIWTTSPGKTCPENFAKPLAKESRIAQIPGIIERAKELSGWTEISKPVERPTPTPPKPAKPVKPSVPQIGVDGLWGPATTKSLQRALGTPEDGEVWDQPIIHRDNNPGLRGGWSWDRKLNNGSTVIRELQRKLRYAGKYKGGLDGWFGPVSIRALQSYLGTPIDGYVSRPSTMVRALQRKLNTGKLF